MSLQEQINLIDQQLKAAEGAYKEALLAKKAVRVARLEAEAPVETTEEPKEVGVAPTPKRKRTNAISKAVEEPVEEVKEEPVIDEAPVEESA